MTSVLCTTELEIHQWIWTSHGLDTDCWNYVLVKLEENRMIASNFSEDSQGIYG